MKIIRSDYTIRNPCIERVEESLPRRVKEIKLFSLYITKIYLTTNSNANDDITIQSEIHV